MIPLSDHFVGALFGVVAAVALSVTALAIRRGSSTDDGSSFDALLVVLTMNAVLITPIALLTHYPTFGVTRLSLVAFATAGVVGAGVGRMAYFQAIELIGASRTEPIKASMPLFATLFAVVALEEYVSQVRWGGIFIIIGGIAVISRDISGSVGAQSRRNVSMTGFALGVAAAVFFGLEPIFAKVGLGEGTPSLVGLVIKTVAAAVFLFGYGAVFDKFESDRLRRGSEWRWYVAAGFGNTVFLIAYYSGLAIAPVSLVTPLVQTSPLFVATMAYLFLPDLERITRYVVTGTLLVVAGATLITIAT